MSFQKLEPIIQEHVRQYSIYEKNNLLFAKINADEEAYLFGYGRVMHEEKYMYVHLDSNGMVLFPIKENDGHISLKNIRFIASKDIQSIHMKKKFFRYELHLEAQNSLTFIIPNRFLTSPRFNKNALNMYNRFK